MEMLQGSVTAMAALASVASVAVARRALNHTRTTERQAEGEADAAVRARVEAVLNEYGAKFERAFAAIERTEAARQRHEIECAKDKAILAERLEQVAKIANALENRMSSWGQQMGFQARDLAEVRERVAKTETST